MLNSIIGMFIGLFGGYYLLYREFKKSGEEAGYRCDKCKSQSCMAKQCWYLYNKRKDVKK